MLMSDIVDWLIPDIPKDISLQIHKEKILLVEVFMKEEQGKIIPDSKSTTGDRENCSRSNNSTMIRPCTGLHTKSTNSL